METFGHFLEQRVCTKGDYAVKILTLNWFLAWQGYKPRLGCFIAPAVLQTFELLYLSRRASDPFLMV